jgi:cytolysin-activating lysine-acyltransferase
MVIDGDVIYCCDLYEKIGSVLSLLSTSELHMQFHFKSYMIVEIFPPVINEQLILFSMIPGEDVFCFVSWAIIKEETYNEMIQNNRSLYYDEWNSGNMLFFNDFVANHSAFEVVRFLTKNNFKGYVATSIRRTVNGSVRCLNRWIGKSSKYFDAVI